MKKILLIGFTILLIVLIFVFFDSIYLRIATSDLEDSRLYMGYLDNEEQISEEDLEVFVSYTGNEMYVTKVYVNNDFEKIFLTKATKESFFNWSYHTVPFTFDEEIDENLINWGL